ncbi:carbohydrate porin [Aquisphaera insulae]|uniref:carbohydrate porin n=1 Tax=Aquisphaera insulae TaxID=2712864 RepID=UPI0013EA63E0|nr:carbohydrate porin [Aquisphaera insulae]
MKIRTTVFVIGVIFLTGRPSRAQEGGAEADPPPGTETVTERLAHPYSIDLLPDDPEPAPEAGEQSGEPSTTAPAPAAPGPPWGRKTVTGDLFDNLLSTKDSGITFGGRVTQFGVGIAGGINRPVPAPLGMGDVFRYTGRGEYDLLFDLEKLGGLPHGRLLVRAEHWYGEYGNISLRAGTFAPPVFAALLPPRPNDPGVPYITDFLLTQPLSPSWVLYVGKKDVLGTLDQDIFAGGDGTDQFMNQSFVANPVFLLGMPYSSFWAGFVSPRRWGGFGAYVVDPRDHTADFMQFGNLFNQGVIIGGEVKRKTRFFGLSGQHHVGAIWKHNEQSDLRYSFGLPGGSNDHPAARTPVKWDSYSLYYGFDQYLVRFTDNPDRGFGMFGRAALSDGNPNPVRYFLSAGVGGFSALGKSRGDTFGLGWFLVGASNEFGPTPRTIFGPRNGSGVEVYYNVQATPWLNITPDVQWLRPGAGNLTTDNAFVYGLRLNLTF